MNLPVDDELVIARIADAITQKLFGSEQFIERVADAIAKRFELLDPHEAGNLLRCTSRTLTDNHVDWGLDKSVAFGLTNPRYFLSQILARAQQKVIRGRKSGGPQGVVKMEGSVAS